MNSEPSLFCDSVTGLVREIAVRVRETGRETVSVMLTGGRSAAALYKFWSRELPFGNGRTACYFGDERCVAQNHQESNYGMAVPALFPGSIPEYIRIERIHGEVLDKNAEARRYASILPKCPDILLLSVGSDGHVASLFPGSGALGETKKRVVPVFAPKQPPERLTITPKVIRATRNVIVMAEGEEKGRVLAKALLEPENIGALPVRLTIGCIWVFDGAATRAFQAVEQHGHHNTRIIHAIHA